MSIQDLRKKLKPVPISSLQEQDQELNRTLGKKVFSNQDQHKIEDGRNTFRIYPPHEQKDANGRINPFAEPKVLAFVPAMVGDKDDKGDYKKNEKGEILVKKGYKPVFNAKIHGLKDKSGNPLTKDLIEEFIRIATDKSKEIEDEEARKKYMLPINGQYLKGGSNNVNGIGYQATWEVYADKLIGENWKFGTLELKKAVKNRMNSIAATESANDPLGTDPFTDLDDGRPIIIIYNSNAKKAEEYYTTEIDTTTEDVVLEGGRKVKALKEFPISDERLELFAKATPLSEIYRNVFRRSDLEIQLNGLKMIDEQYSMGIFNTEEFQAIYEEIVEFYPEEETTEQTTTAIQEAEVVVESTTSTTQKPDENGLVQEPLVSTKVEEVKIKTDLPFDDDADDFSKMTREDLIEFSQINATGILIKPKSMMSDNDLRERLREWVRSLSVTKEVVEEAKVEKVEEVQKVEKVEETTVVTTERPLTAKERLEALKKK